MTHNKSRRQFLNAAACSSVAGAWAGNASASAVTQAAEIRPGDLPDLTIQEVNETGDKRAAEKIFEGLRPMFTFRGPGMHWLFKEKAILQRRGIFQSADTRIAGRLQWPSAEVEAAFESTYAAVEPLFTWKGD